MMTPPTQLRPLPSAFEAALTEQIRTGILKPNDRLPPTAQLAAEAGLPLREVQQALTHLAAQGLIARTPRRGTYVTGKPLTAVLLAAWNLDLEPCYMPRQLVHHLREALEERGMRLEVIHDLYSGLVNDRPAFRAFAERLHARLEEIAPAGFLEYQINLSRFSHVYPQFTLPTIHYGRPELGSDVGIDRPAFIHEALGHLAAQGRRRVAFVRQSVGSEPSTHLDNTFWSEIKRHKFAKGEILEIFHEPSKTNTEELAQTLIEAWVDEWRSGPKKQAPDSLIVADDILLRGIARALLKKGISTPDELRIVYLAHAEITHQYGITATRYELSIKALATQMADLLLLKLAKQRLPKLPLALKGTIVETAPSSLTPPAPATTPYFTS